MKSLNFPDLYRYSRTELSKKKLGLAFVLTTLLCTAIVLSAVSSVSTDEKWSKAASYLFLIQGLSLIVFGAARTGTSISNERAERTWDFQRLTPLTSTQTAIGRLLGAPLLAFFIALLPVPFAIGVAIAAGPEFIATWLNWQLNLICVGFLTLSMGLFISSSLEGANLRGVSWAAPLLAFVLFMALSASRLNDSELLADLRKDFYFWSFSKETLINLSSLGFGAWLLAFAKWRIGTDYLEPNRVWRFPVFLLFLAWYSFGIFSNKGNPQLTLNQVCVTMLVPVYLAGLLPPADDAFPNWLRLITQKSLRATNETPVWVSGLVALAAIAAFGTFTTGQLMPLSLLLFAGRDLCLIQSLRSWKFKRPEIVAAVVLAILYVIPMILLLTDLRADVWLLPVFGKNLELPAASLLSGLVHFMIGLGVLAFSQRRRT